METKEIWNLVIRYGVLAMLGVFMNFIYFALAPATVYPVFWVLGFFDSGTTLLVGNTIFFKGEYIEIVSACVAGAAYYLLLILNLTTPMEAKKRIKSVVFLILCFLVLNIARIILFSWLAVYGYELFDLTHKMVWYFGSTILVVGLWFFNVWLFEIKEIPVYSDVKEIFRDVWRK